jgi:hypothetical protein
LKSRRAILKRPIEVATSLGKGWLGWSAATPQLYWGLAFGSTPSHPPGNGFFTMLKSAARSVLPAQPAKTSIVEACEQVGAMEQ